MSEVSLQSASDDIPADIATMLVTPSAYATDAVQDAYRWLREHQPLGIARPDGFDPFWVVTCHEDVISVSKDSQLFPYGDRSSTLIDKANDARQREITGGSFMLNSLVQMDEPHHMKLRLLTQGWFMPVNIKKREAEIAQIADATVAKFVRTGGSCDFVADVAVSYPLEVIMNIIGVPAEDFPLMLKLTQEIFGPQDPETARQIAALSATQYADALIAVVADFSNYFGALSADRRANPRDDLASLIANAQVDGQPISLEDANGYYIITATAGHDTTSSSTAGGMWALATQPGLLQRLKADPSLITAFVEESVRWTTPVRTFMRSPSRDTELRGKNLKAGDWMMLCYASANRDEAVFADPYSFSLDRTDNKQIAFGHGPHVCLGMHLARMEMRLLWQALLPRLKSVRLAGAPAYMESWFVTGLKRLPITFELEE